MPFLRFPPTPTVKLNGMRAWRSLGRFALILDMTTSLLEKKVEKGGVRFQLARDCLPVMLIERKYVGVHMRYEKPYQTLNRICSMLQLLQKWISDAQWATNRKVSNLN